MFGLLGFLGGLGVQFQGLRVSWCRFRFRHAGSGLQDLCLFATGSDASGFSPLGFF